MFSRAAVRGATLGMLLVLVVAGLPAPASADITPRPSLPEGQEANAALAQRLRDAYGAPGTPVEKALAAADAALAQREQLVASGALPASLASPLVAERAQLTLARELLAAEDALAAAEAALDARAALGGRLADLAAGQSANVDAARALMGAAAQGPLVETPFARAARLADAAMREQASMLGLAWGAAPNVGEHDSPSDAALALLAHYGRAPTPDEAADILALDSLSEPARGALASFIDAHHAFVVASEQAYASADVTQLKRLAAAREPAAREVLGGIVSAAYSFQLRAADAAMGVPGVPLSWTPDARLAELQAAAESAPSIAEALSASGVDLSALLPARSALLVATVDLQAALATTPAPLLAAQPTVDVPNLVWLDLTTAPNDYAEDYALILDGGGDDTYRNNGGGSNILAVPCEALTATGAAAVVDIGGDDDYSQTRECAANGGGYLGAGFLVDVSGADIYGRLGPAVAPGNFTVGATPGAPSLSLEDPGRLIAGHFLDPGVEVGASYHGATVTRVDAALRFVVVQAVDPDAFLASAMGDENVRYAERDRVASALLTTNDPRLAEQWNLVQIHAPAAWDTTVGDATRTICVVDSGVFAAHEDLASTRYQGGIDLIEGDAAPQDGHGHGTHVAGIALASANNGQGIAGVAQVAFKAVRVLNDEGEGPASALASGIRWCADNGANVISVSVGAPDSTALRDAVLYAWGKGKLIVAASGNGGCFNCIAFPAAYAEVIAVGCNGADGQTCGYTSWGPQMELSAPGDRILSTKAPCTVVLFCDPSGYGQLSGTSMSAPHVSGVAALVWSKAPDLTAGQLRQLLRNHAQGMGATGCDAHMGHGIVDAAATLAAALAGERPAYTGAETCLPRLQPQLPRFNAWTGQGVNGGGSVAGLGFLLDAGSEPDVYRAGGRGVNGGGSAEGLGLLLDAGGADAYEARSGGVNGGGSYGAGMLVDVAGNDIYRGEGGGVNGGASSGTAAGYTGGAPHAKAFLLDLSGDDLYDADGLFGTNGGGVTGSGFLLDAVGDDRFEAAAGGVNGGAALGSGMLVDIAGADRYEADDAVFQGGSGANGGAVLPGLALLVDGGGADTYVARLFATNGGATFTGAVGLLADLGLEGDAYVACGGAVNGAASGGVGMLLDAGGDDVRDVPATRCLELGTDMASNGAAAGSNSVGLLVDAGGSDLYRGRNSANGAGFFGVGALVDATGDDTYTFAPRPESPFLRIDGVNTNGGGYNVGAGLLVDGAGDDAYLSGAAFDTGFGANGGALVESSGLLADFVGDDRYDATGGASNGGAQIAAHGFLLDAQGADEYRGGSFGSNGGAYTPPPPATLAECQRTNENPFRDQHKPLLCMAERGISTPAKGFLMDASGADSYHAGEVGVNGGAVRGVGTLLDEGGADAYADDDGGSGADRTKLPKGVLGAQLDLPAQGWPRPPGVASAPLAFAASVPNAREARLAWTMPDQDGGLPITAFKVLRAPLDGAFVELATLAEDNRTFTDATAASGARYVYGVAAVNSMGDGLAATAAAKPPRCAFVGPDAGGYTCSEMAFAWLDATGGLRVRFPRSTAVYDKSSEAEPIALPFAFPWYGEAKTSVVLRSNGLLCFASCYLVDGDEYPVPEPEALPAAGGPTDLVGCYWYFGLAYPLKGLATTVTAHTVGAAPARTFLVEWSRSDGFAFQTQLTESGEARCMLKRTFIEAWQSDMHAAVGIASPDGTSGLTYRVDQFNATNVGVRFAPIPNAPPVVAGAASRTQTDGRAAIHFTDASSDPEGAIERWSWDFGDGATSTSALRGDATHTFTRRGIHPVRLTVLDDGGNAVTSLIATVTMNNPPGFGALGDRVAAVGVNLAFDVRGVDADGDALTYAAEDLPPGASFSSAGRFSWTPTATGIYPNVRFSASDGLATVTTSITLTALDVVADAGPDQLGDVTETLSFSASASQGFSLRDHAWDFGDGASATGVSASHAYAAPGLYTVTLTLRDGNGRSATDTTLVTVTPRHALSIETPLALVETSPGAQLVVSVTVTATGESSDRVALVATVAAPGWSGTLSESALDLAPGEARRVTLTLTAPTSGGYASLSGVSVVARSENPRVSAALAMSASIPLLVDAAIEQEEVAPDTPVTLRLRATFLNGSPAAGALVSGEVAWLVGPQALTSDLAPRVTGADGSARLRVPYDLALFAGLGVNGLGAHDVSLRVTSGTRAGSAELAYDVATGL